MRGAFVLITCEHASKSIPSEFKKYFTSTKAQAALNDHRGYDHGALSIAFGLSRCLGATKIPSAFFKAGYSRLFVDLNRSSHHKNVVDRLKLIPDIQSLSREILARYYQPYRETIEELVLDQINMKRHVLHLSVHSLTPNMGDQHRKNPISLLYDPKINSEKRLAQHLRLELSNSLFLSPSDVRYNYPYLGTSDGLTRYLRKITCSRLYTGLEIEFNQSYLFPNLSLSELYAVKKSSPKPAKSLVHSMSKALIQALKTFNISTS